MMVVYKIIIIKWKTVTIITSRRCTNSQKQILKQTGKIKETFLICPLIKFNLATFIPKKLPKISQTLNIDLPTKAMA
jgi:hypothetical protein